MLKLSSKQELSKDLLHKSHPEVLRDELKAKFIGLWFELETGAFFDQPSAARLLKGLVDGFNGYVHEFATSAYIQVTSQSIDAAINCQRTEITRI